MVDKLVEVPLDGALSGFPPDIEASILLRIAAAAAVRSGRTREQFIENATAAYDDHAALNAPGKA